MKKEYEDYLKERGLPSTRTFLKLGPEIYPAALPQEIAEAMHHEMNLILQGEAIADPELDPTEVSGQQRLENK